MYIGDLCTLPLAPIIVSLYEVCNFLDLIMQYFESCGKVAVCFRCTAYVELHKRDTLLRKPPYRRKSADWVFLRIGCNRSVRRRLFRGVFHFYRDG